MSSCSFLISVLTLAAGLHSQETARETPESFLPSALRGHRAESTEAMQSLMQELARSSSGRVTLLELAKSREGRGVTMAVATLVPEGERDRFPATLVVAGLRPQDEAGVRVASELLARLALDPTLAQLLRGRVFYIAPLLNPDLYGSRLPYDKSGKLNGVATDGDRDRRLEEDAARDLDGDSRVLWMRYADPAGEWVPTPDPWNPDDTRLLRRIDRGRGERGQYRLEVEAEDTDGDGRRGEDGLGSTDLTIHFPSFWQPAAQAPAAGISPLWEPEARGLVDFLLERRELGTAFVLGGSGGEVLFPLAAAAPDELPDADRRLFERLSSRMQEQAGLEHARSANASHPAGGTLLDWLYWEQGAVPLAIDPWAVPEQDRRALKAAHADGDPASEGAELDRDRSWLRWCDTHAPEHGFVAWKPFAHPQLGGVEVGGWLPVGRAIPPDDRLDELGARVAAAILETCDVRPLLQIDAAATRLDKRVDAVYEVHATVANAGDLPTATVRGAAARQGRGVSVELRVTGEEPVYLLGTPRQWVGQLAPTDRSGAAAWLIQVRAGTRVVVVARSDCGGYAEHEVLP